MPMTPNPRTKKRPNNKSQRAKDAELRGERVWTKWLQRDLIGQILQFNKSITEGDLKSVGCLEYLKVKLLEPSEAHHVHLRMPGDLQSKKAQYYKLRRRIAEKLTQQQLEEWKDNKISGMELDEAVQNLTGRKYYRECCK